MINIHPGIFLILAGIVTSVIPFKKIRQPLLIICPLIAFFLAMRLTVGTDVSRVLFGRYELHYLMVTQTNYIYLFVFSLTAIFAGIYAFHDESRLRAFASMAYAGCALGVALAGDWLTLMFFWEFMAFSSLFLIWGAGMKHSTAAGYRYLVVHMIGGNLLLIGVMLKIWAGEPMIGCLTGHMDMAFWCILLGMGVNGAIVPLHFWVPDAYPEGSLTGGVYLSSFTTKLAVLCLMQAFCGFKLLIVLGLIMMFYGACMAMIENDMRRLLSYHIISQLGFMVTDIGIGTDLSMNAASALAYGNVLYKSLLFMCAGAIIYATGIRRINQLGQLRKKMPVLCVIFFIAAFSIAGPPPLAGFTCKSLSMFAAEEAGLNWVGMLMTVGGIGTALSIPFKMGYFLFFGKERNVEVRPLPKNMYIGMFGGAAACVVTGFCPQLIYRMLPYAMDYHPYSFSHILEYLILIPSALIAFLMYLDKMEPHTAISLDVDAFARKAGKTGMLKLSNALSNLLNAWGRMGRRVYRNIQLASSNPYRLFHQKPSNTADKKDSAHFLEDSYRKEIGSGMLWIVCAVIFVALYIIIRHKF